MKQIFLLEQCPDELTAKLGGKGAALVRLQRGGENVPKTACLLTTAYQQFLATNSLHENVLLELNRKDFKDMRWEEIWDVALRIRHIFLKAPMPADLAREISECATATFGNRRLAVRSSAADEDGAGASFAGLHESFLNVVGTEELLHHIKKVWASLWSDRALLYRQELGLTVDASSMAVVIQELVEGEVSGVGFSRDPLQRGRMVIEAVHGLNEGLVDGAVDPDRWYVDANTLELQEHVAPPERRWHAVSAGQGVELAPLPEAAGARSPLDSQQLGQVVKTIQALEASFGFPVDVEWTFTGRQLYVLQARPVTATDDADPLDRRAWYLSLHRSFDNLVALRSDIENDMLPQMESEAAAMASVDLGAKDDVELADEIDHRFSRAGHWSKKYWDDCIPFAHGVRLFGEVYNEVMTPDDPYEFVSLLSGEQMLSTARNAAIQRMAALLHEHPEIAAEFRDNGPSGVTNAQFKQSFEEFERAFGNYFVGQAESGVAAALFARILEEYSAAGGVLPTSAGFHERLRLEEEFIQKQGEVGGLDGIRLLELARASYRLRDDDNIYLGKIEQQLGRALDDARKRLGRKAAGSLRLATPGEICRMLRGEQVEPAAAVAAESETEVFKQSVRARQLLGQPASRGVARGRARVIVQPEQMAEFRAGEVLVVESIDPNMTFLAPLAAAIVEKRGGMLIHGAIIAREYGLPCVTGVSELLEAVSSGDVVTVDGYLGIITIGKP